MVQTIYNDGSKYGDADAIYGRIDSLLAAAQEAQVRQSGLRVQILDRQLNSWISIAGTGLPVSGLSVAGVRAWTQAYYQYRLRMSMCVLSNGTIVRVRNGDGTASNRSIYVQEITDPTNASQWTTWSLLYSGTHYAVAVHPATSSTYHVYSAKSDGVYRNNVLKISMTGTIDLIPVVGQVDALFAIRVFQDSLDNLRVMDLKYISDCNAGTIADDRWNYRWRRSQVTALKHTDGRIIRVQSAGFFTDPRDLTIGESLIVTSAAANATGGDPTVAPRLIRGFGGQAGTNTLVDPFLLKCTDGYYYLFYGENRLDADGEAAIGISTLFWQRTKDLLHWSEPVTIGYDSMMPTNIAAVELNGYIYLANNGQVWRRPIAVVTTDISNYVPEATLDIASVADEGGATLTVANPNFINDNLLNLEDREITIQPGLRNPTAGTYSFQDLGVWWIRAAKKTVDKQISRIALNCYDLGERLSNPFRDVFNFPGQVNWSDWGLGKRNKLFNYYLRGGRPSIVTVRDTNGVITEKYYNVTKISKTHVALYTGWKGHNFTSIVAFRGGTLASKRFGIVYRYRDGKNYYWARINGTNLELIRFRNGAQTQLANFSIGSTLSNPTIKVVTEYGFHYIYLNGTLRITHNEGTMSVYPGYVGIRFFSSNVTTMAAKNFSLSTWDTPITTDELLRTALAAGDFHDVVIAGGEAPQVAVVWGPQTDIKSPRDAVRYLLDQYKLELTWNNGSIVIGQFKDISPVRAIMNESLEFAQTEESGRRVNLAMVDGNEDSYIAIDGPDTRTRGRQIVAYFDVPALDTHEKVVDRATEEIRRGVVGTKYEGTTRLYFDLWRLDAVTWTDGAGVAHSLRIEQMEITINQSTEPNQQTKYTLSPLT